MGWGVALLEWEELGEGLSWKLDRAERSVVG